MRKIKIIILSVCFVMLFGLSAHAAQADVQIGSAQAQAGETVCVSVSLSQPLEIKSMYFAVECSNKEFLASSAKWQFTDALIKEWDSDTSDGVIAFSSLKKAEGEVLQLTVQIPADAAAGEYILSGVCTMQNDKGKTLTLQVADGRIRVVGQTTQSQETSASVTEKTEMTTVQTTDSAADHATTVATSASAVQTTVDQTAAENTAETENAKPDATLPATDDVTDAPVVSVQQEQSSVDVATESSDDAVVNAGTEKQTQATAGEPQTDKDAKNGAGNSKILLGAAFAVVLFVGTAFVVTRFGKNRK